MATRVTSKDIAVLLREFSAGLRRLGTPDAALLDQLATTLHQIPPTPLKQLGQRWLAASTRALGGGGQAGTGRAVLEQLEVLERMLNLGGARGLLVSQVTELRAILSALVESVEFSASLEMLRTAMDPNARIEALVARLKADTGTDRFEATFEELKVAGLKPAQLVEIATAVYGWVKKDTAGRAALAFIRKPHDAHMSAKRGIQASAGRTAA